MIGCVFKKDSRGNDIKDKNGHFIVDEEKTKQYFKETHKVSDETKRLIEKEAEYQRKIEKQRMKEIREHKKSVRQHT